MNGTTRCPYCETRFKIAETQLSAHQGMVRCGHCLQAFDAKPHYLPDITAVESCPPFELPAETLHFDQEMPIANVSANESEIVEEHIEEAVAMTTEVGDQPSEDDTQHPPISELADDLAPQPIIEIPLELSLPGGDTLDFSLPDITPSDEITAKEEIFPALPATEALTANTATDNTESAATPALAHPVNLPDTEHDGATAVAKPQRNHRWLWLSGAFLLMVLLSAQLLYSYRVSLAAHMPTLKPALLSYCQLLRCQLPLPQQSALMSIESSSLDADSAQADHITFSALLRNRADYTQAYPSLALTLNDSQDHALARRLFLPVEYLPSGTQEKNGLASNQEISVKLQLISKELKAAGYRLELFYPHD